MPGAGRSGVGDAGFFEEGDKEGGGPAGAEDEEGDWGLGFDRWEGSGYVGWGVGGGGGEEGHGEGCKGRCEVIGGNGDCLRSFRRSSSLIRVEWRLDLARIESQFTMSN